MLDEKKEEKKSKRQAFKQVLNERREMFYTLPLLRARKCEEEDKEGMRRRLAEPLVLSEEEKRFDEEAKRELEATSRMTAEEWDEALRKKTNKWWYMSVKIEIKEYTNKMKENHKLALKAQEEICNELQAEAKSEEEKAWFKSLSHEDKIAARGALGKQRVGSIKLQNEILQMEEKQLVRLHCMINGFPPID